MDFTSLHFSSFALIIVLVIMTLDNSLDCNNDTLISGLQGAVQMNAFEFKDSWLIFFLPIQ